MDTSSIDRLSAMPDCLLINIISLLDLKDSLITSALSKRWKFLYTEVPKLAFCETSGEFEKIREFVYRVHKRLLRCYRINLESFEVKFVYKKYFAIYVDIWIDFIVKNKVKEVHLKLNYGDIYKLSQIMYSNPHLKVLTLERCFMVPERTIYWKSLTLLRLWSLELRQHVAENILSGCPVLRCLRLIGCWGFNCLEIDSESLQTLAVVDFENRCTELEISAPYIRSLVIGLCPNEQKFCLQRIPSVVRAEIVFIGKTWKYRSNSRGVMRNATELLEQTQHVEVLELSPSFLEVVSVMVRKHLKLPQSSRRSLTISDIKSYTMPHVYGILGLLESSPELETLIIDGSSISKESVTWDLPAKKDSNSGLLHLKKVAIRKFGEPMLTLARILLTRAKVLEEMVIEPDTKDTSDFARIRQALFTYPRSSQKAVVVLR